MSGAHRLDAEDLDLVAALQVAPRAPLSLLAEVLGLSASTVGRRFARLESERLLRVIGQVDWSLSGEGNPWHVWVEAEPGQAPEMARRLAALPEVQLVATTAGRADVYCTVQASQRREVRGLLSHRIPAMPGVRSAHSELVLQALTKSDSWRLPRLSGAQVQALRAAVDFSQPTTELAEDEMSTVRLLRANGRISTAQIARRLGIAQSTAYRTTQSLLQRGAVRPRVEIEPELLGYAWEAVVALTVSPGSVDAVAGALARHTSARYVSVVAGTSSVVHQGVFRDERDLTDFLVRDMADLEGINSFEVSLVLEVLKRHWLDRVDSQLSEQE
jgi:DNA-binding Lrp family transcriptional regulator